MTTTEKTDTVRQAIVARATEAGRAIEEQEKVIKNLQEATALAFGVLNRATRMQREALDALRDHDDAVVQAVLAEQANPQARADWATTMRPIPKAVEGENDTWICPEPGCGEVRDTLAAFRLHWTANHQN
jgi:hypothetical protein